MKPTSKINKFASLGMWRAGLGLLLGWLCAGTDALAFPPQITTQPTNRTVQVGSSTTFNVAATTSNGALTYQWYYQAAKIAGATNNSYTRTNVQLAHAGNYYVGVTNADGGLFSSNAILTVTTFVVTNANNSGAGSLRQAILDANALPGINLITFNIPLTDPNHVYYRNNGVAGTFGTPVATTLADGAITDFDPDYLAGTARSWYRITLTGTDLNVTEGVIIDGSTQPGYDAAKGPIIELNAAGISASDPNGLTLTTGGSTVRGLVINRAGDDGIEIDVNAGGCTIVGNYIGTDVSGLQTNFGNGYGITVKSDGNKIGGSSATNRNVIGGNSTLPSLSFGIGFWQDADNNIVQGNYIGVGADGTTAMGNRQGITFQGTAHNNTIGGEAVGAGNIIANNSMNGIDVVAGINNAFVHNSIFGNGLLGINLGTAGVTPNDPGDSDSGPNGLQNFPVLSSAVLTNSQITITGTLNSKAATSFRIEFYANPTGNSSGNGEGQTLLGVDDVTTDAFGNAAFAPTFPFSVPAGNVISALASRLDAGDGEVETSEFATNRIAAYRDDVATTVTGPANVYAASNFTYTITVSNLGTVTASNIVVSDILPAGLAVVSASGGGNIVAGGGLGQVVFDRASSNHVSGVTNWTHVTTAAANRLLLVGVSYGDSGVTNTSPVTAITYSGLNLTRVVGATNSYVIPSARYRVSELWQLVNPPSGNNPVVLTRAGTSTNFIAGAATFSGVDQTTPLSAVNSALSFGITASVTLGSATNEIVFDTVAYDNSAAASVAGGQTQLWNVGAVQGGGGSRKPGNNFVTMSWNIPLSFWVQTVASVKAAPLVGVVNWTIPTLAPGATTNFTLTVTAPLTGPLSNAVSSTATTPDANPANNNGSAAAAQVVTTVLPLADVVTTQSGLTLVPPLTNYAYTVTVSNVGPTAASSVVVTDTLAPTLTYISSSGGGSYLAGVVTWPAVASLPRGGSTNFTVTVRSPISGTLTNTAASSSATADPNAANNNGSAPAATVITAVSPLQVANTSKGAAVQTLNWSHTVDPGSSRILIVGLSIDSTNATVNSATFAGFPTLTLIGQTNSAQTKVLLYRMLNPQVGTYPISISLSTAVGIVGGAVSFNGVNQTTPIAAFVGRAGSGTNANLSVTSALGGVVIDTIAPKSPQYATNAGSAQSEQWNLAGVNYSGAGSSSYGATTVTPTWELDSATTWAMAAVALNSATVLADVTVNVSGPTSVVATSNLTYTLTVTNFGASTASNVVVSDVLPAGATFVSASGGGTNNNGVVSWPTITSMVVGARTNYTVTIKAPVTGTLTNLAYGTSTTADPDPSNNNGTADNNRVVTTVTGLADVATTVTGPAGVLATAVYNYTVTVTNAGPSPASDVLVSDTLPVGASFVSASDGGSNNAGVVTWPSVASLASGAATTISVTVSVTAPAGGSLTNTVASTASTTDLVTANNNGSAVGARVLTGIYPIPSLTGQRLPSGYFQMEFDTIPGSTCAIEASTNLLDWITLTTTNAGAGHVIFLDQDITNYPMRFYRTSQGQ